MSCCDGNPVFPEMQRLNPDGSYGLQVSEDGGATWQTDNTDPRLTYPTQPPLPDSTPDLKCQAAWNVRKGFQDVVAALAGVLDVTLTLFAISVAIAGVMIAFLLSPLEPLKLVPVVISLVNFLVGLTEEEFTAAFSDSDYEKLQCAAFCSMNDAGQITDLAGFVDKICANVDCDTIPGNAFRLIAWACGLLFVNSMAGTPHGTNTYDCSECSCSDFCWENWKGNFTTETDPTTGTDAHGDYIAWQSLEVSGSDHRTRVSTDGGYPPSDETTCCPASGTVFHSFIDGVEISVETFVLECGDTDVSHLQNIATVSSSLSTWVVETHHNAANFEFRIYKTGWV